MEIFPDAQHERDCTRERGERELKRWMFGVSPSGKARVFGTRIRRFESSHPSQSFRAFHSLCVEHL